MSAYCRHQQITSRLWYRNYTLRIYCFLGNTQKILHIETECHNVFLFCFTLAYSNIEADMPTYCNILPYPVLAFMGKYSKKKKKRYYILKANVTTHCNKHLSVIIGTNCPDLQLLKHILKLTTQHIAMFWLFIITCYLGNTTTLWWWCWLDKELYTSCIPSLMGFWTLVYHANV